MKVCPICKSEFGGGEGFCPNDGARLTTKSQMVAPGAIDPNDPLVGISLGGRYKVLEAIGEGGMGIVYSAVHEVIEKKVAIKVLRDDFSKRPDVVERFRQEAKSASRIGHEHIVDISDFGETPTGQSYFVMEYLDGEDLANLLAREGTLGPGRAVSVVLQCARALGAAHNKGIVHRDMKPENIFLTKREGIDDFVKIVDFGIAKMSDIETDGAPGRKLTKTGMIFGTPEYMSPEQAAGKPLDHRVDVYALGVILFEMITGRVPFVGDTFMGILTQHMFEQIPSLRAINPHVQCPEELEHVIFKALTKDPNQRYGSMAELASALVSAMDMSGAFRVDTFVGHNTGYGGAAAPLSGPQLSGRMGDNSVTMVDLAPRRSRIPMVLGVVAAVLVASAVGGYFASQPPSTTRAMGPDEPLPVAGTAPAADLHLPDEDANPRAVGEPEEGSTNDTAGAEEGPEMVSVEVRTQPAGARVMVGDETVCEPSPCRFDTEAGQSIRIQVTRGVYFATRDLAPSETMSIEMPMVRRTRRHNSNSEASAGQAARMVMSNDLKVPDIFRD